MAMVKNSNGFYTKGVILEGIKKLIQLGILADESVNKIDAIMVHHPIDAEFEDHVLIQLYCEDRSLKSFKISELMLMANNVGTLKEDSPKIREVVTKALFISHVTRAEAEKLLDTGSLAQTLYVLSRLDSQDYVTDIKISLKYLLELVPNGIQHITSTKLLTCIEHKNLIIDLEMERGAKKEKNDPVNHPSHYNSGKIEVIDFLEDQNLPPNLWQVVKYVSRAGKKDPKKVIEDLKKAEFYLQREINNINKFPENPRNGDIYVNPKYVGLQYRWNGTNWEQI